MCPYFIQIRIMDASACIVASNISNALFICHIFFILLMQPSKEGFQPTLSFKKLNTLYLNVIIISAAFI